MAQAFSYIRFSSDKQELGDSLRRQLKLAEDYAAAHGLDLDSHSYRDLGISAFRGKNIRDGALGGFLTAVDEGIIPKGSTLLVENIDRLSRAQVDEALELFLSIIRRGITIVTLQDKQVYSTDSIKQDKGIGLIVSIIYMMRAHEESATKSRRVKEGWASHRAAKTVNANCPAWLKPNAAGTAYVQVPEKVRVVRTIFKLAAEGKGMWLIYKHLEEHNVLELGNTKDGWNVQAVGRILHQQAVIGRLVSLKNNTVIEDYYPAIIDKDVYYAVQEKITERHGQGRGRKGENVANLFSGLLRCGDCGSPMRMTKAASGGRHDKHINTYVGCLNNLHKKGCKATRLNYEHLEKRVLVELLVVQGIEATSAESVVDPSIAIRGALTDKQEQIDKLVNLMSFTDERTGANLLGRLKRFTEEKEELEQQLRDVVLPKARATTIAASLAAAIDLYKQHEDSKKLKGAQLTEVRMKLQSAIKSFVESIRLPSTIHENYDKDGTSKFRAALVSLRGTNVKRLKTPPKGMFIENHGGELDVFESIDTPLQELGDSPNVLTVYYPVPKMGNGGNVGERSIEFKVANGLPLTKRVARKLASAADAHAPKSSRN